MKEKRIEKQEMLKTQALYWKHTKNQNTKNKIKKTQFKNSKALRHTKHNYKEQQNN